MAASTGSGDFSSVPSIDLNDPFVSKDSSPVEREPRHRYSTFDSHLFALGPNASPAQAKRALEAHLAETDRRMEEAGKLGTALVQQRKELTQRLEEVEKLQAEEEVSQELKEKLAEIEKDYNDVARESARAFLPKPRVPSNEAAAGSPFVPEGKGGRRSVSPSKFEAQATGSPTKLSVPNRKLRNQPANRVHDIEFAAEISQSLIIQVRNLQTILAEKEEELRDVKIEKSKLEYDAEGFQQRVKTLDESQNRYKDENWSLETQVHELLAAQRESSDREKKLQQTVSILQAEKNSAQRDLDEVKLNHAKLSEEHASAVKHHDTELGAAKRNIVIADSERAALLRKIEDLTGQNQELAKAISSQRGRTFDRQEVLGTSDEDFKTANDNDTPEHSPPPSPIKATPRHAMLESETLKTSLQHAQRTIQSLRTNVHREKTEKLELRRMLQDARDELEKVRSDPVVTSKRSNKATTKDFKKPPRLLGALRSARSEIFAEDPEWEDQTVESNLGQPTLTHRGSNNFVPVIESVETENFETANETSDQAFETANERGTETDDFHTGAEEFTSDEDAQTETDSPSKRLTLRGRPASLLMGRARSTSVNSTASTGDEYSFEDSRAPTSQLPSLQAKFPLRVSRGAFRRSRQASEDPSFQSSPAGFANSAGGTPQPVQSLAAELGEFDGSDNDSSMSVTPSRRSIHMSRSGSIRGTTASPPPPVPRLPKVSMVDSGTMTEPASELAPMLSRGNIDLERPISMYTAASGSDYSEAGTLSMEENLAKFPSPPTSPPNRQLSLSDVHARDVLPIEQRDTQDAELDSLRQEHARQLESLHAERDAAQTAALLALEARHADALDSAISEARSTHARELESLKSSYTEEKSKATAEAAASHKQALEDLQAAHLEKIAQLESEHKTVNVRELETLRASHLERIALLESDHKSANAKELEAMQAAHLEKIALLESSHKSAKTRELEALQNSHLERITQIESEQKAATAQELETLHATHLEKIAQLDLEHKATRTSELEALKASHAEQLQSARKASDEAHAAELASLISAHAAQIELAKKELNESHAQDLESLKSAHGAQIDEMKERSDATHANELENLKIAHLAAIDKTKGVLAATHTQELEALKAAHATQVEQSRMDNEAAHAAEIAALLALHATHMETSKAEGESKFAQELESLKSTHSQQLDTFRAEADDHLNKQLNELKAAHIGELEASKTEIGTKLAAELDAVKLSHSQALESSKRDAETRLAQEIDAVRAEHAKQVENMKAEEAANLTRELGTLKANHALELENMANERNAAHAAELAALADTHAKQLADSRAKKDAVHAAEIAVLTDTHAKQLTVSKSEADATLTRELASLKDSHARELESLRSEHSAAHAKELEAFEAALAKQLESSKSEGDVAHNEQIEALKAANAEIVEAHKRDSQQTLEQALNAAKSAHERELETLRSDHATARSKEVDDIGLQHAGAIAALEAAFLAAKTQELKAISSQHEQRVASLQMENAASKARELDELSAGHRNQIDVLKADIAAAHAKELEGLTSSHAGEIEALHVQASDLKEKELRELASSHQREIERLEADALALKTTQLEALASQHQEHVNVLKAAAESSKTKDLDDLKSGHASELKALRDEHEVAVANLIADLAASHDLKIEALRADHEASRTTGFDLLRASHNKDLEALRQEHEDLRKKELEQLKSEHSAFLTSLRTEHQTTMDATLENLKANHAKEIDSLNNGHFTSLETALSTIKSGHAKELADVQAANDVALATTLEKANADHAAVLESQHSQSSTERNKLLASHALELEALRKSLIIAPPKLGYSSVSTIESEPIAEPEFLRSPKREAFILPRDIEPPETTTASALGIFGRRNKGAVTPTIAEDETRQSPNMTNSPETPESQRPFKEMSTNTDIRPVRKQTSPMADHSVQTVLTSDGIDRLLLKDRRRGSEEPSKIDAGHGEVIVTAFDEDTPSNTQPRRSQDSMGSPSKLRAKPGDSGIISAPAPVPVRRPGSSGSTRGSQLSMPPLPANHKEAIEAARTGSSHGPKGAMGPPLLPASAYKNPAARPLTPHDQPQSPHSGRGTPTPRAIRTSSTQGYADVQSPTKMSARSRQSSVSSFTSEIDNRFNMQGGMGIGAASFAGPNTDPRMIQAITQTMIGEYLWKYTRKAGRGEMSENRHRRYFWVHPYTRTLYWSDRDPSAAGKSELRAKSLPIEAVRVVTDDNPMPPGLHRKSLIIVSPGRTIKFTCTTGQRHETWFNALSYLLLRTGNEGQTDAEEMAGNLTLEDVEEFNPSYGQQPASGNRRAPPSLSSYNSRTTRNESPNIELTMSIPTLTPTNERSAPSRPGTLGRLSGFMTRTSTSGSIFSSLRSKSQGPHGHVNAIYEASEVNDSAEELRQIIEQQERESDRLENVRACCDGKHDVGTLSRSSKRNRPGHAHTHSHSHPRESTTPTPMSTVRTTRA